MDNSCPEVINSLGVLLWSVARADGKIKEEEVSKIRQYFKQLNIDEEEIEKLLTSTRKQEEERVDLYSFARYITRSLDYSQKLALVKTLFSLAFSDKNLSGEELETIRTIANIFYISHRDFIRIKLDAQKEAGLKIVDL